LTRSQGSLDLICISFKRGVVGDKLGGSEKIIRYKDAVFYYRKGGIIRAELPIKGYLGIDPSVVSVILSAYEANATGDQGSQKQFPIEEIDYIDKKWAETILSDRGVKEAIYMILKQKDVLGLYIDGNVLTVLLSGDVKEEEIPKELPEGIYQLRSQLSRFPSIERKYETIGPFVRAYGNFTVFVLTVSVVLSLLIVKYFCDAELKLFKLSSYIMLCFVVPFIFFILFSRIKWSSNAQWIKLFLLESFVLYLSLSLLLLPTINSLYTKGTMTVYAFVKSKHTQNRLEIAWKQGKGICSKKMAVSRELYQKVNTGSTLKALVEVGLLDVPKEVRIPEAP